MLTELLCRRREVFRTSLDFVWLYKVVQGFFLLIFLVFWVRFGQRTGRAQPQICGVLGILLVRNLGFYMRLLDLKNTGHFFVWGLGAGESGQYFLSPRDAQREATGNATTAKWSKKYWQENHLSFSQPCLVTPSFAYRHSSQPQVLIKAVLDSDRHPHRDRSRLQLGFMLFLRPRKD